MRDWLEYALKHSEPVCDDCNTELKLVWCEDESGDLFMSYIFCPICGKEYKCLVCWWAEKEVDAVLQGVDCDDPA